MLNKQVRIILTVSNDLSTDARLHKVCTSLSNKGYSVLLLGFKKKHSLVLPKLPYKTKRLHVWFSRGFLFYAEIQIRILLFLIRSKAQVFTANDLDTLPAVYIASKIKHTPIVYDSHEYFTEVPELLARKHIQKIWTAIEQRILPKLQHCITVSESIACAYKKKYAVPFTVIKNYPSLQQTLPLHEVLCEGITQPYILYQGALNKGRGVEHVIAAMEYITTMQFVIIGDGNMADDLIDFAQKKYTDKRIVFLGKMHFSQLRAYTQNAQLGVSVEDNIGLNFYYALPNKLYDYIHAGIPVLVSDFPEMKKVVDAYSCGKTISSKNPKHIAEQILHIVENRQSFLQHITNAQKDLSWEQQEKTLLSVYESAISSQFYDL